MLIFGSKSKNDPESILRYINWIVTYLSRLTTFNIIVIIQAYFKIKRFLDKHPSDFKYNNFGKIFDTY